ncbi:AAA family ATPase [Aggregatibacter actinomycetemcomitans]|nr:AAA family ATPase [Aggregatibacter actinomycetemcomitans]
MFFQFNSLSDGDTTIPVHLANLSLKDKADERIALSIRINSHPIFNEHISHKIAVAVIGFCPTATKNPIFIPESVFLTHGQPEPTNYEQQVEAVFHQLKEGQYPKRGISNLLTLEFTKSLPKYAVKTKARLASWLDFLSFKNKLIKHKTQGLRYLRWQFDEEKGQVHFLVIAENEEALKKARAAFNRQSLHTFKTEVSTEPFRFVLPKKETSSVDSAFSQLGQLANQGIKIIQKNNSDKEKLKACEHFRQVLQSEADEKSNFDFSKAVFADVFVDISEELSNRIAGFEDDSNKDEGKTRQEKINVLFKNMPESGFLSISLKGQDQAIEAVNQILIRAYTGLSGLQHSVKARTPKGALFFVGPTGVGKTELAKSLAQFLFGDEDACIRFDMSEFNHEHADQRLVGAPPGYIGFEEGGQLTNAVKTRPFSLLLFDEIEKAHPRILDKFLQILEDGRLTDGKGETISFADTFIVFTSNIGAADIQPDTPESVAEQFKRAVQSHFKEMLKRPELLGRIGEANIIPFNFMQDTDVLKAIARAKLKPLEGRLKEKWGIEKLMFENEDKALDTLVKQVNQQHGGRGVLNVLTKYLFDPLAEFLFDQVEQPNKLKGKTLKVLQAGRHFDFELE